MPVIKANTELCQGYGNCVDVAADYFDIDDDGIVVLLRSEAPEADRGRAEEAAMACPVNAIAVENE